MNDGATLLACILADPTDDLCRLAYADWLEETGECERAQFIRVQVELASLPEPEELTVGTFRPDPDEEVRSRMLCRSCRRLGGCNGSHSHPGLAGQVIHGVLHRHDPRRSHHHCDEACRPCRHHQLTWLERELQLSPAHDRALGRAALPGTLTGGGRNSAITYSTQTNGAGMEFSWRRGFVWRYRGPPSGWMAHGREIVLEHPIELVRPTDVWPHHVQKAGWTFYFGGLRDPEAMYSPYLPVKLRKYASPDDRDLYHPTEEAAREWLSDLFLAYARDRALVVESAP